MQMWLGLSAAYFKLNLRYDCLYSSRKLTEHEQQTFVKHQYNGRIGVPSVPEVVEHLRFLVNVVVRHNQQVWLASADYDPVQYPNIHQHRGLLQDLHVVYKFLQARSQKAASFLATIHSEALFLNVDDSENE